MSGPKTTSTGEIVKPQPTKADNLVGMLQKMLPEIQKALPKHVTPERMARIAMTAVRTTPELALCTPASFVGCVMQLAQLGLEPNTPLQHAWLIPRKSTKLEKHERECTMIVGYQGQIELTRRSGLVANIYAYAVRDGDFFEYELGLDPSVKHRPSEDPNREGKPITHAYAVAKMRDSEERSFVVLTKAQIEARRKRSAASEDGPWLTDYEAMCLKTAVRSLWKWLPKSAEIARAEAIEEAGDRGVQSSALDPTIADALARNGLTVEDAQLVDNTQPLGGPVVIDGRTGEVIANAGSAAS